MRHCSLSSIVGIDEMKHASALILLKNTVLPPDQFLRADLGPLLGVVKFAEDESHILETTGAAEDRILRSLTVEFQAIDVIDPSQLHGRLQTDLGQWPKV